MSMAKVAITLDENLIQKIDRLVKQKVFPNRSKAIQEAVKEKMLKFENNRLARECAKLDPKFEQVIAEEGMSIEDEQWPEY